MTIVKDTEETERGRKMKRTTWLAALVALMAVVVLFQDAFARSRMYHPSLGRFMQRDVFGYVDGMSLYQYAGGNPIVATDSTGGCSQKAGGLDMRNREPDWTVTSTSILGKGTIIGLAAWQESKWEPPGTRATGSIIQHVTITPTVTRCKGSKEICDYVNKNVTAWKSDYYERWDVVEGRLVAPYGSGRADVTDQPVHDNFQVQFPVLNCSAGHLTVSTEAAFFKNYKPGQWVYDHHRAATGLPTSPTSPPDGWSDVSGRVGRTVRWDWDYTKEKPKVTARMVERK